MKILIVSDTHGRHQNLETVLEKEKPLDMLIHLGDVEGGDDYIRLVAECPLEVVAGNNDFYSNLPIERILQIGKYNVLLTHGHYYYAHSGNEQLKSAGRRNKADIVLFGHTHRPFFLEEKDIIVLNPGSLSYPRQSRREPTYLIMEIDEKNNLNFFQKVVDN